MVGPDRARAFSEKVALLEEGRALMTSLSMTPKELNARGLKVNQDGARRSAMTLLGYPEVDMDRLRDLWPELQSLRADVAEQLEIEGRYAGYLARQEADIKAFRRDEALRLPDGLDYTRVGGLSNEVRQKLAAAKPATLGAAARVPGVTPAALTALLGYVKRRKAEAEVASAP